MANEYLSDGSIKICVSTEANQATERKSLVVEGQMLPAGEVHPDQIIKVINKADINKMFGAGSILSESLKVAFDQAGKFVDIYALPRYDSEEGKKAVYGLFFHSQDGVILDDGEISIYHFNKKYNINLSVSKGDKLAHVVALLASEYSDDFLFTVDAIHEPGLHMLLYTAKNAGTVNNILDPLKGLWIQNKVKGLTVDLKQIKQGGNDPYYNDYVKVFGQCCHYAIALCSPNIRWQKNLTKFLESRWDCEKPMCGGHGYLYNRGTIGEILATFLDSFVVSKMAISKKDHIAPYFKNVAYAAKSVAIAARNPGLAVEGKTNGLLNSLLAPETCDSSWDYEEATLLKDQGFVVAESAVNGYEGYSSPQVQNDVTNFLHDAAGKENYTYRQTSTTRLIQQVIEQMAKFLSQYKGMPLYSDSSVIPIGQQGYSIPVIQSQLKTWAAQQIGRLFSGPIEDDDIQVVSDFDVAPPCYGEPGLLHVIFKFKPPIAISKINARIVPKLIDNCDKDS